MLVSIRIIIFLSQIIEMIPTMAEPIAFHSGPVDEVCPQDYLIMYEHSINSFCFDLEATTFFIYHSQKTKKIWQFFYVKLPIVKQRKYGFCTSWHSICKIQRVNINCYVCREALTTPRCRATDFKGCTEQFLKNKMHLSWEMKL